ncbi:MAG: efflux RND transporter periplasmic adaptor subunit [Flammeovirgaceae bacterium]|nr:efflux RND transporter periplasmic adaptor subunit [Flammeovirgaceae bacterium]
MEFLETEYQRQQELAKENVNAQKTLQQSKSDFLSISAKVNGLKKKLEMINIPFASLEKGDIHSTINIYAPISGYVTKILVSIGAYVNPSDQMFEIVDTKHLHAELEVFEQDVPKLKSRPASTLYTRQ